MRPRRPHRAIAADRRPAAGKARLLGHPGKDGYALEVDVKFGEPLELPEPWDLTLDTGRLSA